MDRDVQYCSKEYLYFNLKGIVCCVSMTEDRDHRDNAIADHVNDILKEEWLNKKMITPLSQARNLVDEVYNTHRPHRCVDMCGAC